MKIQSQATPGKSLVSAFRTGILVAAAFFAGLGVANLSAINGPAPAQTPLPQGSEEAQPETTAAALIHHRPENRPPSNEIRDWYVTKDDVADNGQIDLLIEHYKIQEIPFLVAREYRNKDTNQLVQKDTIYNYRYYPNIKESYMPDGKLGASRHFYNFSEEYFAPESAQFKYLLNDGSYDIVDVEYNISAKLRNTKSEQPAKQKSNTDELTNDLFDAFFGSYE